MALQASGQISLSDVNVELGNSSNATINIGGTAVRDLFGLASGAISMSSGYGASAFSGAYSYVTHDSAAYASNEGYCNFTDNSDWDDSTITVSAEAFSRYAAFYNNNIYLMSNLDSVSSVGTGDADYTGHTAVSGVLFPKFQAVSVASSCVGFGYAGTTFTSTRYIASDPLIVPDGSNNLTNTQQFFAATYYWPGSPPYVPAEYQNFGFAAVVSSNTVTLYRYKNSTTGSEVHPTKAETIANGSSHSFTWNSSTSKITSSSIVDYENGTRSWNINNNIIYCNGIAVGQIYL
jgi:hypothetical protein